MTQPFLPNKEIWKNSKGVSGIIAAIFLVLIVFFLYANVFTFILIQNTSFQEGVSEVNQRDIDRSSEKITVSNVDYAVAEDQVYVHAQVTNDGPVSVQIITLWVIDTTIQKYGYNDTLNINLKAGDSRSVSGEVTIPGTSPGHVFNMWFVTARGNLISFEKRPYVSVSNMTEAMGPLLLDYKSLMWYSTDTGHNGTWQVPTTEKSLEWSLNVINWGHESINLSYDSIFMILSGGGQSNVWYIKHEYTALVDQKVSITFCWDKRDSGKYITSGIVPADTYAVYVVLVGTYASGKHYGQTIPFVAIKVV